MAKQKSYSYRGYNIVPTTHQQYTYEPKGWDVINCAGHPVAWLVNIPSVRRCKIGIALRQRRPFSSKLIRYLQMLSVNRHNYSQCYGPYIPMQKLYKLSKTKR